MRAVWFATRAVLLAILYSLGLGIALAQATNSGDIRGTVTDPTGALIPGVTVTVTNVNTGITKLLKTDKAGLYDTSSIVVGTYSVTFDKPGFQTFKRSAITLQVGTSTVNAKLNVGSTTQEVVVNTDIPLLTTETGSQSTTFEADSMRLLPNVGQDWQNFAILIPGSSGVQGTQANQGSVNPGQEISVNGNLPYSNVLSDGASTTLGTSQNSDVDTFETVAEVQVSTSAFSAQYGIGGVIFNQITKGGTSQFHGSAYEYFQSSQFNANSYQFNNEAHSLPFYRFNNFGASVGGPVALPKLRKKAFFYFDYDQVVNHGSANGVNSIPTPAVMAGDFSGQSTIYDPTTQTIAHDSKGNAYPIRQSFQSEYGSNAIPVALFSKLATNFQKFYPTPDNHIAGGQFLPGGLQGQGILQNNFYASVPQSNPNRKYFGRLDYDITPNNRITGSVTEGDIPAFGPSVVTACPVGCGSSDVSRLDLQVTDVWTINSHLINEARVGFTYQGNFFGDATLNQNYPQQLGWQFAKANEIPGFQFYTNYPYAWIEPSTSQYIYKENVFDPSDVVTFIRGKHVLHFGGEVGVYRNDNTPYAQINPGILGFTGQYTSHWSVVNGVAQQDSNTGTDYSDFLLGDANSWSAQNGSEYGARLKNPQVFIQDDYKVRPNLTLNLGIRYQIRDGINEVHGNDGVYDPTILNPATNTPGAYWYGVTHGNGRNSLQANSYATILPRVGFAWLPHPDMTVRGGFGVYAYNLSIDTYGGGLGNVATLSGNYSDPTNGVVPGIKLDGLGTENLTGTPLPFATPGTSPTRFNGQGATYNAYHTPDPKIYQWNLSVQQALGTNMVVELAYVASHGFDLVFPTDLNQIPTADLSPNDTQFRPNPNYTSIGGSTNDAISNYNSLQASIQRRLTKGLSFDFNYTWSHLLDDQDSSGWGSHSGPQDRQYQDAASNYSNSDFDLRNAFKGRVVYELPVGRGRAFFNHNWLVDEVLGGYQVSSTLQLTSGSPFSVFAADANTYAEPGKTSPFPNYSGLPTTPVGGHTNREWYNPAAFTLPANGTFGNVRRNSLYGPGIEYVNISAGKEFAIHESVKLQIRLDATNAFNHPSFGQPANQLTGVGQVGGEYQQSEFSAATGQISGVQVGGRTLQGGLRLQY